MQHCLTNDIATYNRRYLDKTDYHIKFIYLLCFPSRSPLCHISRRFPVLKTVTHTQSLPHFILTKVHGQVSWDIWFLSHDSGVCVCVCVCVWSGFDSRPCQYYKETCLTSQAIEIFSPEYVLWKFWIYWELFLMQKTLNHRSSHLCMPHWGSQLSSTNSHSGYYYYYYKHKLSACCVSSANSTEWGPKMEWITRFLNLRMFIPLIDLLHQSPDEQMWNMTAMLLMVN